MTRTTLLATMAIAVLGAVLFMIRKQRYTAQVTGGYTVSVVVVAQDVPEGVELAPPHVSSMELPPALVEARHVLAEDINEIFGVRARHALRPGAALRWTDLKSSAQTRNQPSELLEAGMRAVSVNAGSESFNQMMSRGDRVDVLYTGPKDLGTMTVVIAQNVMVLADEVTMVRTEGQTQQTRQVTLAVDPDTAALLEHSERKDSHAYLSFAARNPEDALILDETPTASATDLIEAAEQARRQRNQQTAPPPSIHQIL